MRYLWLVLSLLFSLGVSAQGESNEQTLRDFVNQVYNEGDIALIADYFAEDYVRHPVESNRSDLINTVLGLRGAMPDLQATIEVVITQGDFAALRMRLSGTFQNVLTFPNTPPIEPTGQPFTLLFNSVFRFDDNGLIVEEWVGVDNLLFLAQAGLLPPPQYVDAPPIENAATIGESDYSGIINRYFDDLNRDGLTTSGEIFTDDFTAYTSFGSYGYNGLIEDFGLLRDAIPDLVIAPQQIVSGGEWGAVHYTLVGTFTNNYVIPGSDPISPTGNVISISTVAFFRFTPDGRISGLWSLYDNWQLLTQLGLILPAVPGEESGGN